VGSLRYRLFFYLPIVLCFCSPAFAQDLSVAGANSYIGRHDWNGLIAYATKWTRENPQDPLAWYYLGNAYGIGLSRPQNALPAFEQAARLKPQWPELWTALGHVHAQLGQYRDSADAFARAAQQNPRRMIYWFNLAAAYTDEGQWALAKQALDNGERSASTTATWPEWFDLGNGYLALKQFQDAAAAYERSLRMHPDYAVTWNNLGVALEQGGNVSGALAQYRHAAAMGDPLGRQNRDRLQNAMQQAEQQPARRGFNGMAYVQGLRAGQAQSYMASHPEATFSQAMGATSH
jgi:tetratricopeptide (TPR) repeat protein